MVSDVTKTIEYYKNVLVMLLLRDYPGARLCGYRNLCFETSTILAEAPPPNLGYL